MPDKTIDGARSYLNHINWHLGLLGLLIPAQIKWVMHLSLFGASFSICILFFDFCHALVSLSLPSFEHYHFLLLSATFLIFATLFSRLRAVIHAFAAYVKFQPGWPARYASAKPTADDGASLIKKMGGVDKAPLEAIAALIPVVWSSAEGV